MSTGTAYALIIRQDQHSVGRYLASCPGIPAWFATGTSAAEASSMGAEIVRGIVTDRRANGIDLPEVSVQTSQVVVGPAGSTQPGSPPAPAASPSIPNEAAKEATPNTTLASVVARSREPRAADGAVFMSSESPSGRVLKSEG